MLYSLPNNIALTVKKKRFEPGPLVITSGAKDACNAQGADPLELLARHIEGDWGQVCQEDAEQNERWADSGGMIMSEFKLPNEEKIWVISDPFNGVERTATTLLLPEEY